MGSDYKVHTPKHPLRVITATSLFDGHDAAINIFRRIIQGVGVEVIHLGHNRSVEEIVGAAVEEDVQAIAVSSYQGGHLEFFKYMLDCLQRANADHIKVFGGGGGVIVAEEIAELESYGVTKIYTPQDGARMGLTGIVNHLVEKIDHPVSVNAEFDLKTLTVQNKAGLAGLISLVEQYHQMEQFDRNDQHLSTILKEVRKKIAGNTIPVVGLTGTGGSGKSSLADELILRVLHDFPDLTIAVISCDPSRRKTGGALLGDRIRMNTIFSPKVYMRSLATRASSGEIPKALKDILTVVKAAGYDLILVETAGIGQGDSLISDLTDLSIYVMTSEFGAATQLEKIDMLDYADLIAINKYEKQGSEDALRDVRKQVQRNRGAFELDPEEMPVYGTVAAKFNDDGVTALYHGLLDALYEKTKVRLQSNLPRPKDNVSGSKTVIIPLTQNRYLAEIAETIRNYHAKSLLQAKARRKVWHLTEAYKILAAHKLKKSLKEQLLKEIATAKEALDPKVDELLCNWSNTVKRYQQDKFVYHVRERKIHLPLFSESLARQKIPKIALPKFEDPGQIYLFLRKENLPGYFPFTAGVFPLKRVGEDPARMFAGEGDPARTNRRFKLLSADSRAKRLSTAFDSVTLYGCNPDIRPDIYGKVGTSGVSICTLDDVKVLYDGFNLTAPNTSVSMTINGPAPIILAMFFNTAIDQQIDLFTVEEGRSPEPDEYEEIRSKVLACVRGTVQADILKEDQGQNTCIFSIDFALKMMGDIQDYFIAHKVRNFYSVSISGYHIAEAGANPITQLALTLANGFTYVEYYLSRGMAVNTFAPNLSFFFSNGMDPEYTVIGRVARRIWAIAMREKYGADERSQMLKYHIQTSGRSLHSQEIQFNDIRTTLQALCAVYDNCNSLHTNAYDEAVTTPSKESVRRAQAIQLIINREWGLAKNENPHQGSFIVEELTDLVEEAVLTEFDRISSRGGVLGAMETGYQRSKIQEESIYYESLKHSGRTPIIGVNTFINPGDSKDGAAEEGPPLELVRATKKEKQTQLHRLADFHARHKKTAPAALKRLQNVALKNGNIFEELMETVKTCSLGQIVNALYAVGGKYRRNM